MITKMNEPNVKKIKALDITEINLKIVSGEYHIHKDKFVPGFCLEMWKNRGYNPHKRGVVHVRYPPVDKKYTFPLYFWVDNKEKQ